MSDLHQRIKAVMIEELMLQESPEDIENSAPLFGPDGLGLDSVDALQLAVAMDKNFGLKMADAEQAKEFMVSVDTLAKAIEEHGNPTD